MLPDEYKNFIKILEVDKGASLQEVTRAYLHLKDLYSHTSTETIPVEQEFLAGHRQGILKQLDTAYSYIKSFYTRHPGPGTGDLPEKHEPIPLPDACFNGSLLQQLREECRLSLEDIARDTKISAAILACLESEEFDKLPPAIYVRGYVAQYAKCLNLDHQEVVGDYMARYDAWQRTRGT